ncbi:MAG: DUF11 domain-containing protein [Anaerolineae bacterium]|nr:DUF11 domain-containing protein [Anaerolineae bacterium]
MKNQKVNKLILAVFTLFFVVMCILTSSVFASNNGYKSAVVAQGLASATPVTPPTDPPPPITPPTATPSNDPTATTPPLTGLPPRPLTCSVAPKTSDQKVNVRNGPSESNEIITQLPYRWYAILIVSDPDNKGVEWIQIRLDDNSIGWVAASVTQVSQSDCINQFILLRECQEDIQRLAPANLTGYVIDFFGDDCNFLDQMLNLDVFSDSIQDGIPLAGEFENCPMTLVDLIYLRLQDIRQGTNRSRDLLGDTGENDDDLCDITIRQGHKPQMIISSIRGNETIPVTGQAATYTIIFQNNGKGVAHNVVISNAVPQGAEFVDCTNRCSSDGTIFWSVGIVNAGQSGAVSLTVKLPAAEPGHSYINTASVDYTDSKGNEYPVDSKSYETRVVQTPVDPINTPQENTEPPTSIPVDITPSSTLPSLPTPTPDPLPANTVGVFVEQDQNDPDNSRMRIIRAEENLIEELQPEVPGQIAYPSFSPDGLTIAFLQKVDGQWQLRSISLTGSNDERTLLRSNDEGRKTVGLWIVEQQIVWLPDGKTILLTIEDGQDQLSIYWVDVQTFRFGLFIQNASAPAISPKNKLETDEENKILFAFQREGRIFLLKRITGLVDLARSETLSMEELSGEVDLATEKNGVPDGNCSSLLSPVFNDSEDFPLYFVCDQGSGQKLMLYYRGRTPEVIDVRIDDGSVTTFNRPAALPGWYLTFDDGNQVYLVELEKNTSTVVDTIPLGLGSSSWDVIYMNWKIEPSAETS